MMTAMISSDFEGVWLADEDNLYENCYIEFDWDGS